MVEDTKQHNRRDRPVFHLARYNATTHDVKQTLATIRQQNGGWKAYWRTPAAVHVNLTDPSLKRLMQKVAHCWGHSSGIIDANIRDTSTCVTV